MEKLERSATTVEPINSPAEVNMYRRFAIGILCFYLGANIGTAITSLPAIIDMANDARINYSECGRIAMCDVVSPLNSFASTNDDGLGQTYLIDDKG